MSDSYYYCWGRVAVQKGSQQPAPSSRQAPRPKGAKDPTKYSRPPKLLGRIKFFLIISFSSQQSLDSILSASFLLVQPSLCLNPSETRRQTFQSPRKYYYALLFITPPRGLTDRFVSSTVRLKTHPQTTPLSLLMPNSLVSLASKKVTKKNKTKILFPFEVLLYVLFPHPRFSPISPHFFFYSSLTKSL